MAHCFEKRGCDAEMAGRCPHNAPGEPCPVGCRFALCDRATHEVCQDFEVLLNPHLDYEAAVKEACRFCMFFLTHGPLRECATKRPAR